MNTTNEDPDYRPVKFALNRAVFHKELTDAEEADRGIAEYAALLAVAEAANALKWYDLPWRPMQELKLALAKLAAVREGEVVSQSAGKLDNYTRDVVAAEFGYKCCESGLNLQETIKKLRAAREGKAVAS